MGVGLEPQRAAAFQRGRQIDRRDTRRSGEELEEKGRDGTRGRRQDGPQQTVIGRLQRRAHIPVAVEIGDNMLGDASPAE